MIKLDQKAQRTIIFLKQISTGVVGLPMGISQEQLLNMHSAGKFYILS
jgi:hypothetical protein